MRSRRSDVNMRATIDRAKALGLCGFGGALRPAPPGLESAIDRAAEQYDVRLADRIGKFAGGGGIIRLDRDPDMLFWLGRIEGRWLYDATERAAAVDLVHVRGGFNFQQIHSPAGGPNTQRIWDDHVSG
jgi:hypothetical protein